MRCFTWFVISHVDQQHPMTQNVLHKHRCLNNATGCGSWFHFPSTWNLQLHDLSFLFIPFFSCFPPLPVFLRHRLSSDMLNPTYKSNLRASRMIRGELKTKVNLLLYWLSLFLNVQWVECCCGALALAQTSAGKETASSTPSLKCKTRHQSRHTGKEKKNPKQNRNFHQKKHKHTNTHASWLPHTGSLWGKCMACF